MSTTSSKIKVVSEVTGQAGAETIDAYTIVRELFWAVYTKLTANFILGITKKLNSTITNKRIEFLKFGRKLFKDFKKLSKHGHLLQKWNYYQRGVLQESLSKRC